MNVGEDMILTEAVIAHALAAIPELQLRIVRIRAAAHGTLVVIPLLLLLLMDGLLEVHRLPGVLILLPLRPALQGGPAKIRKFSSAMTGKITPPQFRTKMARMMPAANSPTSM
mgnify:CR=1 FL=1